MTSTVGMFEGKIKRARPDPQCLVLIDRSDVSLYALLHILPSPLNILHLSPGAGFPGFPTEFSAHRAAKHSAIYPPCR